jgi:hypothetical protein
MGLWGRSRPHLFPERAAQAIGWRPSPFQFEIEVANLAIGVAGLYAAFQSFEARFATNLVLACFLIVAGIGHIRDMVASDNFAPGNAGPILFTDFLTPAAIFVLALIAVRSEQDGLSGAKPISPPQWRVSLHSTHPTDGARRLRYRSLRRKMGARVTPIC